MTEEGFRRKLTAILSADVEGYSRLMGDDEEATIRTLTTYRNAMTDLIQKYRGRVVDAPGDNLLAEFASVVDGVNCAVEIQRELAERNNDLPDNRKMQFRIGVNLGDVVEEEGRIYGDGVNIAARVESLAEAGGICIAGTAYDQVVNKLDLEYEFLGEQEVKNIERPIRVYRVLSYPGAAAHRVVQAKKAVGIKWRKITLVAIAVVVVGVIAGVVWNSYFRLPSIEPASVEKMAFPLPDKPSIAVLPFVNMSGDPEQEYIADGFSENIITVLSKIPDLFVIARNSSFTYKGKPVKVQQVSEDLGVRYVLEGSIQKTGEQIRVTAQLIDTIKGHHLWAEKYDRVFKDFFDLLDEITFKIANALQVKLISGNTAQYLGCTGNLEAWGFVTKAVKHSWRSTKEDNAKLRELCERALKLDTTYVCALVLIGWSHWFDGVNGWSESPAKSMKLAFEFTQKALNQNDAQASAHQLLGWLYLFQKKHDKAVEELKKAISIDPNFPGAYYTFGAIQLYNGYPEEATALLKKAMRLHPYYPPIWLQYLSSSYLTAGRYEEAIALSMRTLERSQKGEFNPLYPNLFLAELYIHSGQNDKAKIHAERVLELNPKFSLDAFQKLLPYKDPVTLERRLVALRKAGLPDKPPLPLPDKPSIAVLPFTNMSGDPEQEYFSDGMTDDLITDLSKISGLLVIARNSTFAYKDKSIDIKKIAGKFNVRYVLEGSVRKVGQQVRINAQLIDGSTGHHLWAERYDGSFIDIFSLQDKIVSKIVAALSVKLTVGEQEHIVREDTNNIAAYEAFLKGSDLSRVLNHDRYIKALSFFEKAIELDPNYSRAYGKVAEIYYFGRKIALHKKLGISQREMGVRWINYIQLALKNPTNIAYQQAGEMYVWQRQHEKAIAIVERALEFDESDLMNNAYIAFLLLLSGRMDDSDRFSEKGLNFNPGELFWYSFMRGLTSLARERYEEAVDFFKTGLEINPQAKFFHAMLAAAYGHLGFQKEAQAALNNRMKGWPSNQRNLRYFMSWHLPYKYQEMAERFADGLLKAGLAGEPSGYYKIYKEHKLSGEEIRGLFFGRKIIGSDLRTDQTWWIERTKDGRATYSGTEGTEGSDSGKSWVEDDMLCDQWENLFGGLKECWPIFRNPEGSHENQDEYLGVPGYGIYPFSVKD